MSEQYKHRNYKTAKVLLGNISMLCVIAGIHCRSLMT